MNRTIKCIVALLLLATLLGGCGLKTVDQLYCLPERSDADSDLQAVIDKAMDGLSYSAPIYGENRQPTQKVDLDGDGVEEFLVFAKDDSEKPLKILIFCQLASGYVLMDTIEGYGFAFDFVEYAQIDGQPGLEIVVGRQVSNEVMRSVSVYRFASEISRQLLTASYAKMDVCDLDGDGISELLILKSGDSTDGNGVLSLYELIDDQLQRTSVTELSGSADRVKRMTVDKLQDGTLAVFTSSITKGNKLVTDVFAIFAGDLTRIHSTEPITSLSGQELYPADIDDDGILELPALIPMSQHPDNARQQYFVRWYSLQADTTPCDKLYTCMNYSAGWYLTLTDSQTEQMSVVHTKDASTFYLWDAGHRTAKKIMTVYTLTDSDREQIVQQQGYTVLFRGDAIIHAVKLEPGAADAGFDLTALAQIFHVMRTELNTDEN